MTLNVRGIAVALGTTTAAFFILCSLLYMAVPGAVGWSTRLFHIDVSGILQPITPGDVIVGAICWGVLLAVIGGAAAWLYNRLAQP